MTEQSELTPNILPPQETPEIHGPVSDPMRPLPESKPSIASLLKKFLPFIVIFCILLVILVVSNAATQTISTGQTEQSSTPTPTTESRIYSSKTLSSFASQSAFMKFDAEVEALPNIIQGAVLQDASVLPPIIELPLGFSN